MGGVPPYGRVKSWAEEEGYALGDLQGVNLWDRDGRLEGRVAIPCRGRNGGRLEGLSLRSVDGREPKYHQAGNKANGAGLWSARGKGECVLVVEGDFDSAAVRARLPDTPVIALSGKSLAPETVAAAVRLGLQDFFLALDADSVVIATERTFFSFPETRLGIYPVLRGTLALPQLIHQRTGDKELALALSRYYILAVGAVSSPRLLKHLGLVDFIFPNQAEAGHLTGHGDVKEAVKALSRYGIETVALKLGERGCTVGSGGEIFSAPTFAVEVQDTTGAGDSFDAGFILGWLWGLSARESAILANALGALAASAIGAGDAWVEPEKARALLQEHLSDPGWQDWTGEIGGVLDHLGCCTRR